MEIVSLRPGDALWEAVAACAEDCSWRAGKGLAQQMREGRFQDWERVFALAEGTAIAGYCALVEVDCLDVPYRPFIGYVFVGEPYRGQRWSEKLIRAAMAYAGAPTTWACTRSTGSGRSTRPRPPGTRQRPRPSSSRRREREIKE